MEYEIYLDDFDKRAYYLRAEFKSPHLGDQFVLNMITVMSTPHVKRKVFS